MARKFNTQSQILLAALADGQWRTLDELKQMTGISRETSLSANLRHLRKAAFGGHKIERRCLNGVWEYRHGA